MEYKLRSRRQSASMCSGKACGSQTIHEDETQQLRKGMRRGWHGLLTCVRTAPGLCIPDSQYGLHTNQPSVALRDLSLKGTFYVCVFFYHCILLMSLPNESLKTYSAVNTEPFCFCECIFRCAEILIGVLEVHQI